jgi:hypothetical protein
MANLSAGAFKMTKDLILSYATDIQFDDLRRLIVSARKFCPSDQVDIVVIINSLGDRFAELADEHDVQLFSCYSVWKQIRPYKPLRLFYRLVLGAATFIDRHPGLFGSPEVCNLVHRTLAAPWLHASCQRYIIAEDLLRVRSTYRMVFLTDARDVVLQANPFDSLDPEKLHVFLHQHEIYGEQNIDSTWLTSVLGSARACQLKGKVVSCCGTTIGGRRILLTYLKKMISSILQHQFHVLDQVPHNEIIYLDFPPDEIVIHPNADGEVLTLAGMTSADVDLTENDVRLQGKLVPVVHMYDRVKEINDLFYRLYPSGANSNAS